MANMNNQGKRPQQYRDSTKFAWYSVLGMLILLVLMLLLSGCYGTYYLTDAEYSDAREENTSLTYYNNQIYDGWDNGYYYYYGKPHYYPWYYYYHICPPSHYSITTHITIDKPVNKPTHRPRPIIIIKKENHNIKISASEYRDFLKSNNKVIIKSNNESKRTNKTTIRRKSKK